MSEIATQKESLQKKLQELEAKNDPSTQKERELIILELRKLIEEEVRRKVEQEPQCAMFVPYEEERVMKGRVYAYDEEEQENNPKNKKKDKAKEQLKNLYRF
jgi:hypothetical protein